MACVCGVVAALLEGRGAGRTCIRHYSTALQHYKLLAGVDGRPRFLLLHHTLHPPRLASPGAPSLLPCSVRVMRAGIEARGSCWWVQRLFNMSTITREWVALQHAHLMPFR